MEPTTTTLLLFSAVFSLGTMALIFIRNLMLSHDKKLNDKNQHSSLQEEIQTLSQFRKEIVASNQFTAHYQSINDNKKQVDEMNEKIDKILKELSSIKNPKMPFVQESLKKSKDKTTQEDSIGSIPRELDDKIKHYEKELESLQVRRGQLWQIRDELEKQLVEEQKTRNKAINDLYRGHTSSLEKLYLRHNQNSEHFATKTIEAGTQAFKLIFYPLGKLLEFLKPTALDKPKNEPKKTLPFQRARNYSHRFFKLPESEQSLIMQKIQRPKSAKLMI